MTADERAAVLTARRAAQHFRLSVPHDAYEHLCILTILPKPRPVSTLCWQIHRLLTVLVPTLRPWVHCSRASNGLLPRRSNLVGYAQWDARFDRVLLVKQSFSTALQVAACDGTHGLINPPCTDNQSNSFTGHSHPGFSFAIRTTNRSVSSSTRGRPQDLRNFRSVELVGDELSVPGQQRIRFRDSRQMFQGFPSEPVGDFSQRSFFR